MKISIITTTFNSEKTLEKTLTSIKNQSHKDIECVWIDNSSTDKTFEIFEKNKVSDSKLFKVSNFSISEAWNYGIEKSNGDIIYFMNSDDIFYDEYVLSDISNQFLKHKCNIVFGDINYINKTGKIIRKWKSQINKQNPLKNSFFLNILKYGWMPPHPGFFILKKYLMNVGKFNTNYKISFDYDFMVRALKDENINAIYYERIISKMLVGGNSNKLSNIKNKMIEDYKIIKENSIGNIFTLLLKNLQKIPQFF